MKGLLLISLLFVSAFLPIQKEPVFFKIENDFGVVDYNADTIARPEKLKSFFIKLDDLKTGKIKKVSILHIGDSHIQADWITGRLRNHFQKEFGNAGRGLIFPARAARSNESFSFISSAAGTWESKRAVFPDQPLPIGIGGITLNTADSAASIKIEVRQLDGINPYHQKLTFFYRKDPLSYFLNVRDSADRTVPTIGPYTKEESTDISTVYLNQPTRLFSLQVEKTLPHQQRFTLYGINLENENSGILYHSIGVNGAKVKHYMVAEHFMEQTRQLQPDLILISLGTNESLEQPERDPNFEDHLNKMALAFHHLHSGVPIIFITPPGNFKNRTKKNPATEEINSALIRFTDAHQLPLLNLYEAGGGKHFTTSWSKKRLLQEDGVHFTRTGYELQGDMIYLALINAYNRHAEF
ncbi:MAG: hypothetical protein RL161_829 [Bacteroidota bacterium]